MTGHPDLESLRLLVRLDELGSIGMAARAVSISQPSATKRLLALEHRAAMPLLVRTPRGSRLTADGKLVAAWATRLLGAAEEFRSSLAALSRTRGAQLSVVASMTVAEALLPRWLHELRLREPHVHVALVVTNSAEVPRLLQADDRVDLGFLEGPTVPSRLARRVVGHDELIVVVAPAHPWARRTRPVSAAELAATPLVVREEGSGTRETLDRALRSLAPSPPHIALGSNSAVKGAAMAGAGPAVLSRYAVAAELAAGLLAAVSLADLRLERTMHAVWPRGRRLAPAAVALLRLAHATRRPEDDA